MKLALKGFLLAVLTAALVATAVTFIWGAALSANDGGLAPSFSAIDARSVMLIFVYFLVFAFVSLAVVGIPLTGILSKYDLERAWTYPLFGFVTGLAVALLFATPIAEPYQAETFVFQLIGAGIPGSVAGIVWWRTYRKHKASRGARL